MITLFVILFLRKTQKEAIKWMYQYKGSIGIVVLLYALIFSAMFLGLHFVSILLIGDKVFEVPGEILKSPLAGNFTEENLHTRITLLIWGWWGVWLPWMSSLAARFAVKTSFLKGLLLASILPIIVFTALLITPLTQTSDLNVANVGNVNIWPLIEQMLSKPFNQALVLISVFGFMLFAWGNMKTFGDVQRGAMYSMPKITKRSLRTWMKVTLAMMSYYTVGWLFLGWYIMQCMVTLGGLFIFIVVAFFILSWGYSLLKSRFRRKTISVSYGKE
jgi:hypothetical protein